MKFTELPESAFAVYSKKLKQKEKVNPVSLTHNGAGKVHKKKNSFINSKGSQEMKEIGFILKTLASRGGTTNSSLVSSISNADLLLHYSSTAGNKKNSTKNCKSNSDLPKQTSSIDKKKNTTKNHTEKAVQNLDNENSNQIKNGQSKKKSQQSFSKNYKRTQDIVFEKGDVSQSIQNNFGNTKITIREAQNDLDLPIQRKRNKKTKVTLLNQSIPNDLSEKYFKTKHNPSLEVEISSKTKMDTTKNANKKNIIENISVPSKKVRSVKINKRSNQLQKSDVNKKISNKLSDWTNQENSLKTSKHLFEWLILPIKEVDFMNEFWEKQPLLIQREGSRKHYSELLSTPVIDAIFRENSIFFTKHVDVTSYTDGVRETHNLSGRAHANVIWDFYSNGCSVRLLNPQAFVPRIHALNASLQEYFGCFVGANVYLTPPNSQGFAPHYDDIEAFVLQIEGKKRWKVYAPRNETETLPRVSSPNFSEEEIGKPVLEVTLEPGDMLYFPRGFIHQASTVQGEHSLHITLSAYQKTAWVDLLEKALPIALKRAAAEDVEFRRGLPLNYLGLEHHASDSAKSQFVYDAMALMTRLEYFLGLSLGAGVDQMGAQFMHDALPPVFTPEEKLNSGLGGGLKIQDNGSVKGRAEIVMKTQVRLIRANICRLVEEEEEVQLYHCLDNPLEYHAEEPQFLVLPIEGIAVITVLAQRYPAFVKVKDLPHDDEEALLTLLSDLWDAGLLLTKGMNPVTEH